MLSYISYNSLQKAVNDCLNDYIVKKMPSRGSEGFDTEGDGGPTVHTGDLGEMQDQFNTPMTVGGEEAR